MRFIDKIKQNKFVSSVLTIGMGNFLAQIFQVITIPMASRLYSQEAYGEYGIVLSTATIITGFSTLGLTSAIMVPKEEEEVDKVFLTAFYIQLLVATVIAGGMLLVAPAYEFFAVSIPYPVAVLVMYIYILLANLQGLMNVYINKKEMNRVLFYNPLIGAVSNVLILLPLGLLKVGFIGFFISIIISNIIINVQMLMAATPFKTRLKVSDIRYVIKKYKNFILYQFPSNFIGNFAIQYPTQYLSKTFGNKLLGSYSMCTKMLEYPTRLVAAPISTVYFRTASSHADSTEQLSDLTYKMIKGILLLAILPMIVVICWGEEVFTFVLGEQWGEAGILAGVLILQYVLSFCSQCTSYCRVAIGKQKINLLYTIFQWGIVVASLSIGYMITGTLIGTITFFTVGNSCVLVSDMAINFYCLKKNFMKYLRFIMFYIGIVVLLFLLK